MSSFFLFILTSERKNVVNYKCNCLTKLSFKAHDKDKCADVCREVTDSYRYACTCDHCTVTVQTTVTALFIDCRHHL